MRWSISKHHEKLLARQQALNILTASVVVLSFVMIGFLIRNHRKKKLINRLLDQRVRDRTHELELYRHELTSELQQQTFAFNRAMTRIIQHVATIKGLCTAASGESPGDLSSQYLTRIDKISCEMEEEIKSQTVVNHRVP